MARANRLRKCFLFGMVFVAIFCDAAQQKKQDEPAKKKPTKRVHVDLAGFELDKTAPPQAKTQIGGGTRGIGSETTPLSPRIGRCYTGNPTFVWTNTSTVQNFEFQLFDQSGSLIHRARVQGRQLLYPADAPALEAGKTYQWSVQPEAALLGGPSRKSTLIRIGPAELEGVTNEIARRDTEVADPLEWRAQVFRERRLWYDAVAAWSELIQKFPGRADLREQRGIIYDQIPETAALAEEDFLAADRIRSGDRP